MKKIFLAFLLSSFFIACDKEAGEGGTSSIEGQVWELFRSIYWKLGYHILQARFRKRCIHNIF